ncbi:MAG TPA: GlsB/YeaQ/YmgE family stress response membrane protein [Candidatus Dormibacteraeota bacterium]|nr:GlsB/YeaQ/YmgE family stress response membrane protein [Candidatus Dormibacteraeota bacterium]
MSLGDILIFIVIALIAGFAASLLVMGRGRGLLFNIIIGVLGALFGGWLASQLHIAINLGNSFLNQLVVAFAGAVLLLLIWRVIFRRGK